ncbi:MAG: hypothetical protein GEV12_00465 [Micromonosporaceae bacterium]|nr:hypothetical protein [Micromonosporaceae bacterium]
MNAGGGTVPGGTHWSAPRVDGLGHLLEARQIAVVGASDRNFYTSNLLRRLAKNPEIRVVPVNPHRDTVYGEPTVPSITDAGSMLDLAIIGVKADQVLPALAQAAEAGVPAAVVISGGFAESADPSGRDLQNALAEFVAETDMRVLGPSCLGMINVHAGIEAFAGHQGPPVIPGKLAVVSQSGANCHSFIYGAWRRAVGLSYVASTGNEVDIRATDLMAHLVDDPATTAIAAFLEQVQDLDAFEEVASRCLELGKPLVLMKVGRTLASSMAASAHTGASPGSDAVFKALFEHYGVIRANTIDQLLDIAPLATSEACRMGSGSRRVFVVSVAGGSASAVADLLDDQGMELPPLAAGELRSIVPANVALQNPMDVSTEARRRSPHAWRAVVSALAEAAAGGWVLVVEASPFEDGDRAHLEELVESSGSRIVCASIGDGLRLWLDGGRAELAEVAGQPVPVVLGLRAAVDGMSSMATFCAVRRRVRAARTRAGVARTPVPPVALERLRRVAKRAGVVGEADLGPVLDALGIRRPRQLMSSEPGSLVRFAADEGLGPVVLKGPVDGVAHKSELGLVRLNVQGPAAIQQATLDLQQRMSTFPQARPPYEVILQEQVTGLCEVVVSASRLDAGRVVVTLGWGGKYVELLDRTARRLAPLTTDDVSGLLEATRLEPVFAGYRSDPPGDRAALARLLATVGALAIEAGPALEEIELNPVIVQPAGSGAVAVDALARTGDANRDG